MANGKCKKKPGNMKSGLDAKPLFLQVDMLKCIQKSNVIKKRIWVLVFGFMYLVLVDAMD